MAGSTIRGMEAWACVSCGDRSRFVSRAGVELGPGYHVPHEVTRWRVRNDHRLRPPLRKRVRRGLNYEEARHRRRSAVANLIAHRSFIGRDQAPPGARIPRRPRELKGECQPGGPQRWGHGDLAMSKAGRRRGSASPRVQRDGSSDQSEERHQDAARAAPVPAVSRRGA